MSKVWWFWALLFIATCVFIALLPAIGNSTPAYRLYLQNRDTRNYYHVRIKNEDTGYFDAVNIEPNSCITFHRMEPGDWSIRTYKDGRSVIQYEGFDVTDEDLCIRINSNGILELCNQTFCD